jgi:hypothetical protein
MGHAWTLSPILTWRPNQTLDLVLELFWQNHWVFLWWLHLDNHQQTLQSIVQWFIHPFMMLYLTLLVILATTSESYTCNFCSDDFREKLKKMYDNNYFLNTILPTKVMHHNIYHLWSVHGVASSSTIRRLTNGCASGTTSGCLGFPKSILLLLAL